MDIRFTCSHCGQSLTVDQQGVGLDVPCPGCGRDVRVPERSDEPKPPPKPPTPPPVSKPSPPPASAPSPQPRVPSASSVPFQGITSGQATAIIVILVIGLFVIPFFHSAFNQVAPPPEWEYKIVTIPDESFDSKMNQLGEDGWELVFARRASDGDRYLPTFSYEMVFKRPKRL